AVPYPAPTIRMELNKESECIREKYIKLIDSKVYHYSAYDNPPKLSKKVFTFKALKEGECRVNVVVFRVYSGFF
ncbi:MAG: hypothetical protein SVN78_08720, partial [Deferribacterota bacterium]|nr:hypothetical protein [Deferribacterota bacterium]